MVESRQSLRTRAESGATLRVTAVPAGTQSIDGAIPCMTSDVSDFGVRLTIPSRGDIPVGNEVEEAWSIIDPLTRNPPGLESYEPASWGPPGADRLAAAVGGWHRPFAAARVD